MTPDNRPEFQQINTSIEANGKEVRINLGIGLAGLGVALGEFYGPLLRSRIPLELTTETAVLLATVAISCGASMLAGYRMGIHELLYKQRGFLTESPFSIVDFLKSMLLPPRFRRDS